MVEYRVEVSEISGTEIIVRVENDGKEWWIPKDPANSDYQRYLRHLAGEDEAQSL